MLSPLLFLLFINDLESLLKLDSDCLLVLYADDTSIVVTGSILSKVIDRTNDILNLFYSWCSKNKLIVNLSKAQFLSFSLRRQVPDFQLFMNGQHIKRVEECCFLGLRINSDMSWSSHIDHMANKLNSAYLAIVNLKNILTTKQLIGV